MFENYIGDTRLGVGSQAWSILHALSGYIIPEGLRVSTYAWYNGRERGVALVVNPAGSNKTRRIVFGEDRRSDQIFIDFWHTDRVDLLVDPPHHTEEGYASAYERRRFLSCLAIDRVVAVIRLLVEQSFSSD